MKIDVSPDEVQSMSTGDVIKFFEHREFLQLMDFGDIQKYLNDKGYFAHYDEEDAIEALERSGSFIPFPNGRGLYRYDCIKLIEDIVNREGWDYLYSLIENQKIL